MEPELRIPDDETILSLEQRIKYFATDFVSELESTLTFHYSILRRTFDESGKLTKPTLKAFEFIAKNIFGTDKFVKFLEPLVEKTFQTLERNQSLQYHELVYSYHQSKIEGRQLFVDIAVDVFESFESQFLGITSREGYEVAIQRVAKDAAKRFLNSFKSHGELYSSNETKKTFQKCWKTVTKFFDTQLPPLKSDFKLNSQKVIEGKSKSRCDVIPKKILKPGYDIQYKCIKYHKECEMITNDWKTSNLFDKVGVAVKKDDSEDYDVYTRNISKCDKYGYRRLLLDEVLISEYKCAVKCKSMCMHPQYFQLGDFYTLKRKTILKSINDDDEVAVNRKILNLAFQTNNYFIQIKDEIEKQGIENRNHELMVIKILSDQLMDIISGQEEIMKKIENVANESRENHKIQTQKIDNVTSMVEEIHKNKDIVNGPISFCVKAPVKSFEGRNEQLKKIHESLIEKSTTVISHAAAVIGLGGVGKTELSKKYAQEHERFYKNRVFINSEKRETLQNSFKELAKKIGIRLNDENNISNVVEETYSHLNKNGKTLMVFDNVEEYKDIKPFIFNGSSNDCIHTLITSRYRSWKIGEKGDIKVIDLNKFTVDEAVAYLKKCLKDEDEADLKSLNNLLDGLPLAIWQVVGYINQQNEDSEERKTSKLFKVKDYVRLYEKDQWKVLLGKGPDEEDDVCDKTIATTWTITMKKFEQIGECGELALSVLKIISYLAPDDIDVEEILKFEKDEHIFGKALKLLKNYSMVNLERGIVSVHRLVQRAVQIHLIEKKEDGKFLKQALKLLEKSYFQRHIATVWEHVSNYPEIVKDLYYKSKYTCWRVTPMHLLALYRNNVIAMAKICEHVSDCVNCQDADEYFPLHNATNRDNMSLDVVKFLIEQGAVIDCEDYMRNTPLLNAIKHGEINVVRFFLEKGADVNGIGNARFTPLIAAIDRSNIDIVKFLVEKGADVNLKSNSDILPLHWAIRGENEEIIKYLITKKPKCITKNNYENNSPLDEAVFLGLDNIVEILMTNYNNIDLFHASLKKSLRMIDTKNCQETIQSLKMTKPDCSESLLKETAALHLAVKYCNVIIIEDLLNCGMDVNKLDENGNTPLKFAVEKNNIEVFETLLNHGANFETKFKNGETVLHYTAKNGAVSISKLLLDKGADPNIRDNKGRSPFHWAVEGGNISILELFFQKVVNKDMPDINGETPLLIAAKYNKCEAVKYLINLEVNLKAINKKGESALHISAKNGALDVSDLLLSKGVDPNIRDEKDRSAFHWAAEGGNVDILKLFTDKIDDIDLPDKDGSTALLVAASHCKSNAVEYLLNLGANPNATNKKGESALHFTAINGYVTTSESLLRNRADPNIRDEMDRSPFHCAAERGWYNILKLFIDQIVDVDMPDKDGNTALLIAVSNSKSDAVEFLLSLEANPNATNKKGESALHVSARNGSVYLSELLLNNSADPNIRDKVGRSPFHCAAERGSVKILNFCINKGVDINMLDKCGETPLYLAAYHGQFEAIEYLLKKGANSKIVSKRGLTLLQKAVNQCDDNALQLIKELGFKLTVVDKFGKSLLHLAARGNNEAAIQYLFERGIKPNIADNFGRTPLHDIQYCNSVNLTSKSMRSFKDIKNYINAASVLIENGGEINACDKIGRTALHYASAKCHRGMIDLLLEKGAEANVFDSKGRSPLHHLSRNGKFEIVKLLLEHGADPRKLDKADHSLLHLAAVHFRYRDVDEILSDVEGIDVEGIDVNARDVKGKSPLHLAAECGRVAIVDLFIRHWADTSATDKSGSTPFDCAVKLNRTKVVNFFNSKSSATQESDVEVSTSNYVQCI